AEPIRAVSRPVLSRAAGPSRPAGGLFADHVRHHQHRRDSVHDRPLRVRDWLFRSLGAKTHRDVGARRISRARESIMIVRLLESVTMLVLLAVVLVLGWMIAASYAPEALRLASANVEIIVIVGVLAAALLLVSVVALLHTRPRDLP